MVDAGNNDSVISNGGAVDPINVIIDKLTR